MGSFSQVVKVLLYPIFSHLPLPLPHYQNVFFLRITLKLVFSRVVFITQRRCFLSTQTLERAADSYLHMAGNKAMSNCDTGLFYFDIIEVVWEGAKRTVTLHRSREGKQRWVSQQTGVLKRRNRCQRRKLKKHQRSIHFCCNLAFAQPAQESFGGQWSNLLESVGKLLSAIMGRLTSGDQCIRVCLRHFQF